MQINASHSRTSVFAMARFPVVAPKNMSGRVAAVCSRQSSHRHCVLCLCRFIASSVWSSPLLVLVPELSVCCFDSTRVVSLKMASPAGAFYASRVPIWVEVGQELKTKPLYGFRGRRSPVCKAYDALPPHGSHLYSYPPDFIFGPILAVHVIEEFGFLTVAVPHRDVPDWPVYVNIAQDRSRFAFVVRPTAPASPSTAPASPAGASSETPRRGLSLLG